MLSTSLSLGGSRPLSSRSLQDEQDLPPAGFDLRDLPLAGAADAVSSAVSQVEAPCLSAELLTEVRWLSHLATTQDERASEDDWRLLALLLRSEGFRKALSPLSLRAQLDAMSSLRIDCKTPGQLLSSPSLDFHSTATQGPDAAGLVLHGSLQLLGAAPGQEHELQRGNDIPYSRPLGTAVGMHGTELLRLPHRGIQEATAAESHRAAQRGAAAKVLQSSSTLCRGQAELQAIRCYLDSIPIFQGIPDESLLRLCQHLHVVHVPMGQCLVKAGTTPDGLRIMLCGTAAVCTWEGDCCMPLRCMEAWFCEDQPLECWELCLVSSSDFRRPRDIVALSESCDVLFLPRAECGPICDALKDGCELRRAALKALVVKSRTEEEAIQPRNALPCDSSLLQAQDNHWRSVARKRREDAMEKMQLMNAKSPSPTSSFRRPSDASRTSQPISRSGSLLSQTGSRAGKGRTAESPPLPGDSDQLPFRGSSARGRSGTAGTAGTASFWSGTQLICWHETLSPDEEEEQEESECLRQSYVAAQSWAEELAGVLVEGLLAFSPSISNSSMRLLPRRGRRELCRQAQLWRPARGEVLRGERMDSVMVVLHGHVGLLEKDPQIDDDLPPALLEGLAAAAKCLFSTGVPVTEQVKTWLESIQHREQMSEQSSLAVVNGLDRSQRDLAASLVEVMMRRYKDIYPPVQHALPLFLSSSFLDHTFLGEHATWVQQDLAKMEGAATEGPVSHRSWTDSLVLRMDLTQQVKAKYMDISAAGHLQQVLKPGELLECSARQVLVAIEPRTDILMMEPAAASMWLEEFTADTSFSPSLADALRVRTGSQLTAKDLAQLSKLLLRHEIFESLENRCLRDVCRSTRLVSVGRGEFICQAGQESTAFIQILAGTAVAESPSGEQLQLPQGSAVGEDVLLGLQEHWPFSLRAESDVHLACLEASAFREVCMDLSGQAAARRRVLEAVCDEPQPCDLCSQDPERLLSVLKLPILEPLEHDQRLEVAKEARLHQIGKGGFLELPKSDSIPFFVVLKGVMGRYEAEVSASPPSLAEESQEAPSGLEEKLRAQEERQEQRRLLEKDIVELVSLHERLRLGPLDVSMQDRLRFHALKIQVRKRRQELSDEEEPPPAEAEPVEKPQSHSSQESFTAPVVQQAANVSAARHSGVFLTTVNPGDADAASVTSEMAETVDDALAEFCEGDSFGGWISSEGSFVYRAHKDVTLLSISEAGWEDAMGRCMTARRAAQGKLLRDCLACDDETVEKLLPLFREETRRKGSVLVKAGQLSSSLWLIAGGRCSQAAAAPKPVQEVEDSNKQKRVNTPKAKRRFFSAIVELGLLEAGQAVGMTSVALQQPEPLTVTAASPEVRLLRADNLPQAKLPAKVLEALRSALQAKASWLGQRLESLSELPAKLSRKAEKMHAELERAKIPLVVDSPFLRRRNQALLPGMVALEAVCKHFGNDVHPESEWIYMHQERDFFMHMHLSHEERESRILAQASQASDPPPRPVGQSTIAANARFVHHRPLVWKTFRMKDEVLLAPESSAFSKQTQEHEISPGSPHRRSSAGMELVPAQTPAGAASGESSSPDNDKPGTPDKAKKVVTFNDVKEASSTPEEAPVNEPRARSPEAAPGDAFKRKPQIKLRANSRIFQMSNIEVDINERRAMKEAKLKASYAASREPLVTPRDNPAGHRTTARQRAALAKTLAAVTLCRLGEAKTPTEEPEVPEQGCLGTTTTPRELFEVVLPRLPAHSVSIASSASCDKALLSSPARRLSDGDDSELSVSPQASVTAR